MTRITRRQLLGTVLAAALGLTGWYVYAHDYENLIVSILRSRLGYLSLTEGDLEKFADKYIDDKGTHGLGGHLLALGHPLIEHIDFTDLGPAEIGEFESRVVSRFLLSSDFFGNGADESLPVRYVVYNNPYRNGCVNPFARFD